mgnify:CR=1 FL=1
MTGKRLFPYASSGAAVEQLEHEMQDSHKNKRVHTRNNIDSSDAEEHRETKQSAARPGRAPLDHHRARAMLNTTARDQKGGGTQGG